MLDQYDPKEQRKQWAKQAMQWASMALQVANAVPEANRNEECDQAACAANHNLGELAERWKDWYAAAEFYDTALELAGKSGWSEGVKMAKSSLKRVEKVRTFSCSSFNEGHDADVS